MVVIHKFRLTGVTIPPVAHLLLKKEGSFGKGGKRSDVL